MVTVASHDTQSAVAAVPTQEKDFLFISCGTWSLFGTELEAPLINEASAAMNITNERGVEGTTTFLKNIIGLWLIQESRRQWQREGQDYSFAQLEKLALAAKPFQCLHSIRHDRQTSSAATCRAGCGNSVKKRGSMSRRRLAKSCAASMRASRSNTA